MKEQRLFKALADPSRRKILRLLQGQSMTAGELAEQFPFSAASLSHHFSVLKTADLVRTERRGQNIVYAINTSVVEDLMRIVLDLGGDTKETRSWKKAKSGTGKT
jgi:DNA-binding transcriptional ArsR family regulator